MTPPRILMITGNAPPVLDGVGDCTDRLLAELVRQRPDWRWHWLARRPRWYQSPLVRRGGVTLLRPSHSWTPRGIALACATARAVRPDLVHIQEQIHSFHETDGACRLADAARGVPIVATLHEYHVERPSVVHTTALAKRASVVIANDPRNAERCRAEAGRDPDHLWWSGSTVPGPEPDPDAAPRTIPGRLTTFGFLTGLKSLGVVAEAVRRLRAENPALHWHIVGPFDPGSNPLHAELARTVGGDGVTFTGAVDQPRLQTLLAETEVMLLPFADGASERRTTLHAAWAYGLPVLTTPPPTARTTIADGVNCLLVREPTADAWVEALRRVRSDQALADRLRAGSLAAAEQFSWRRLAGLHLDVYEQLLR